MARPLILLTGASGGVAQMIIPLLAQHYDLRLTDRADPPQGIGREMDWQTADLTDRGAMDRLTEGVEGVIHLGGHSVEGDWDTVSAANIEGLYNILSATVRQNVPRFVFASSNHAVGFYPRTRRIGISEPVRPDSFYGVSKAFGEALVSLYCDKHALRAMSIRIGNVAERPADHRRLSIWLHPEDLVALLMIGLEHPDLHHAIVYGASHNERAWWDNAAAFALGYQPRHSAEDHREHAFAEQEKLADDPIGDKLQGGSYCSDGFAGDLARTLQARLTR